jgi:ribosomal protein S18 acetylase RimI-like enzyme
MLFAGSGSVIIRALQQSDIPACLGIACEAWDRATAQMCQPDLESAFAIAVWKPFFYVAEVESEVVAMGGYGVSWLTYGVYNLFWHAVRKSHRGRGIGRAMVNRRLDDLRPIANVVMIATKIPDYYSRFWNFRAVAEMPVGRDRFLMLLD